MKLETTIDAEKHEAKIVVEVEDEHVEQAKRRAARQISQRITIPGFRPGKAPYAVVSRMVGEERIFEEAIEALVDELYPKVLQEANIRPGNAGRLEALETTPHLKLNFTVPLEAEVQLPADYRQIRLPYEPPEVTEAQIQHVLFHLQMEHAILEAVERPVQAGDMVDIELSVLAEPVETTPLQVYIEEEPRFPEHYPFPDFPRQLIGMRVGETRQFSHVFGEDAEDKEWAGKEISFQVTVKQIHAVTLPTLEELAKQDNLSSAEELIERVRRQAESVAREDYNEEYAAKVISRIREGAQVRYHQSLLDDLAEEGLERLKEVLADFGIKFETYLESRGISLEEAQAELREVKREGLEQMLILEKVREEAKLVPTPSFFGEMLARRLYELQQRGVDLAAFSKSDEYTEWLEEAKAEVWEEITKLYLVDLASGKLDRLAKEETQAEASEAASPVTAAGASPSSDPPAATPEAGSEAEGAHVASAGTMSPSSDEQGENV